MALFSCSEDTSEVVLPYYNEATFTPNWFSSDELPDDFHKIPNFSLTNQLGNLVTEKKLDGKVTVVDFFFTSCPGICLELTNNMTIVQNEFLNEDKVLLLSHSVTPMADSVEVLDRYGKQRGVNSKKWYLLTGDRSIIYDLGRNHYFIEESLGLVKDKDAFIHTENYVIIDKQRRIRGIYNGLSKNSIRRMSADMKVLLKE
jgi:protein SCO1/2